MHTTVKVSWKTYLNIRNGCATGGNSRAAAGIAAAHSKGCLPPSVNVVTKKRTIDPSFGEGESSSGQRRRAAGGPLSARTAATRPGRESPWKCTRKKRAPNGARFFVVLPPAGRLRRFSPLRSGPARGGSQSEKTCPGSFFLTASSGNVRNEKDHPNGRSFLVSLLQLFSTTQWIDGGKCRKCVLEW